MKTLVVAFDEHCTFCQSCARLLGRMNKRGRIVIDGARTTRNPLLAATPLADRIEQLHATDGQTIFKGWKAVAETLKRFPLFAIFGWAVHMFDAIPYSDRIYKFLSSRRSCTKDSCRLAVFFFFLSFGPTVSNVCFADNKILLNCDKFTIEQIDSKIHVTKDGQEFQVDTFWGEKATFFCTQENDAEFNCQLHNMGFGKTLKTWVIDDENNPRIVGQLMEHQDLGPSIITDLECARPE